MEGDAVEEVRASSWQRELTIRMTLWSYTNLADVAVRPGTKRSGIQLNKRVHESIDLIGSRHGESHLGRLPTAGISSRSGRKVPQAIEPPRWLSMISPYQSR